MKDIDWSKAPEGATHYNAAEGRSARLFSWMQKAGGIWYFYDGSTGKWARQYDFPEPGDKLIARPTTPQWNGEGLPPVGVVCEFMWNYIREGSEYVRVRVLAHDEGSAILRVVDGDNSGKLRESRGDDCGGHPMFRPVRTPEQIAAEERDGAIKDMVDRFALYSHPDIQWRALFEQMYDCGCRMTAEDE